MHIKKIFILSFILTLIISSSFAQGFFITDWKGSTNGGSANPKWLTKMVDKNNYKFCRKEFDISNEYMVFYTIGESGDLDIAEQKAKHLALQKLLEETGNQEELTEINNLVKVTTFWQKLETKDKRKKYIVYNVYKIPYEVYDELKQD